MFATVGPMARHAENLDLALAVLAERRPPPAAVERVAVFGDDGLQPVSRACREAVRAVAAALADAGIDVVESRPPDAGDLRVGGDEFSVRFVPALIGVLVYRLFNFWLPIVPALILLPTIRELRARFQTAEREQTTSTP
jgi:hypothetical protein